MGLSVRFWGVRGSIACGSECFLKYGGNTSCVEVAAGPHRFVLDAGTGIRMLSKTFIAEDVRRIHLLLSHTHWDHINGLPFFRAAYDPNRTVLIHAGHLKNEGGIRRVLSQQMREPVFPVPLSAMKAIVEFEDFEAGDRFSLYPDVHIRTAALNHPNGATAYRIDYHGKSACYVTDTEHVPGHPNENILGLIDGADLVIYDSTYTEEEFPERLGWGHSTWEEGMKLCTMAGARKLAIFHHDPDHDDAFMDDIEAKATRAWDGNVIAREGMVIDLE